MDIMQLLAQALGQKDTESQPAARFLRNPEGYPNVAFQAEAPEAASAGYPDLPGFAAGVPQRPAQNPFPVPRPAPPMPLPFANGQRPIPPWNPQGGPRPAPAGPPLQASVPQQNSPEAITQSIQQQMQRQTLPGLPSQSAPAGPGINVPALVPEGPRMVDTSLAPPPSRQPASAPTGMGGPQGPALAPMPAPQVLPPMPQVMAPPPQAAPAPPIPQQPLPARATVPAPAPRVPLPQPAAVPTPPSAEPSLPAPAPQVGTEMPPALREQLLAEAARLTKGKKPPAPATPVKGAVQ